jgi:hypothetical protein
MGVGEEGGGASPLHFNFLHTVPGLCVCVCDVLKRPRSRKNGRHYHFTPMEFNANVAATLSVPRESLGTSGSHNTVNNNVSLMRLGNVTVHVEVFGGPGQSQGYPIYR